LISHLFPQLFVDKSIFSNILENFLSLFIMRINYYTL